jgi:hypothetical protein
VSEKPPALFWWVRIGCAWGVASARGFLAVPVSSPRLEIGEGIGR